MQELKIGLFCQMSFFWLNKGKMNMKNEDRGRDGGRERDGVRN